MRNAPDPSPWDLIPVQCQAAHLRLVILILVWWQSHSHFIRVSVTDFLSFPQHWVFCPALSAHGSLHAVRFDGQKNTTPLIKKLLLLQTIFLALTPKIKVTGILQVNPYWLPSVYPVIIFSSGLSSKCPKVVFAESDPVWTFQLIWKKCTNNQFGR